MYLELREHVARIFNASNPEHEYRRLVYTKLLPLWKAIQLAKACAEYEEEYCHETIRS